MARPRGSTLTWNAKRKQYLLATDGRPDVSPSGRQYSAGTVVVQYVATHKSGNRDVNGQPTPVVDLVGKGKVTVLRDGRCGRAPGRARASPRRRSSPLAASP